MRKVLFCLLSLVGFAATAQPPAPVGLSWDTKIAMRDGVDLRAMLYRPPGQAEPVPCLFTMTPYTAPELHDVGAYYAAAGYVFATVEVRGRGDSGGTFNPFVQEADDGHDIVEWLARQPYCNGKVGMWGVSYLGYAQWATARRAPPHLAVLAPSASPMPGVDFPMRSNISRPYIVRWLALTSGRTSQQTLFNDLPFWNARYRDAFDAYAPFATLDARFGSTTSPIFQQWIAHPAQDAYWRAMRPGNDEYARIDLPILTITGHYDADQPGALTYYREHLANASASARAKHYLVIGPWDHAGVGFPEAKMRGLEIGKAGVVDTLALHRAWYDHTLKGGPKPELLKSPVAYYVSGAEEWRHAESLDAIGASPRTLYLSSHEGRANDVYASGDLVADAGKRANGSDAYVYDPLDVSDAELEPLNTQNTELVDQRRVIARRGKQLVYHGAPFETDTDVAGFFRFSAWIALDQRDTDLAADVYAIAPDGTSIHLTGDRIRARYRASLAEAKLATPGKIERYDFTNFLFVARRLTQGSRLRLVIGPVNSPHQQKNYNSGGVIAQETAKDAKTVRVTLHHDASRPSALYVPVMPATK
jgi:putative CocE/NonD family hydrolase